MKKHLLLSGLMAGVLTLLLLILALGLHLPIEQVKAQQGPEIHVGRGSMTPHMATVLITGTGLSNLGGFEFDLNVNPAVVQVKDAQTGSFLGSTGRTVGVLGPIIDSRKETIGFGAYTYDPDGSHPAGANGQGALASVTLDVLGEGVSTLTLSNPIFADVDANEQQVTTVDAALQVRAHHVGWNLMAPCVDTSQMSVTETLQSMDGSYDVVLGEDGTYVAGLPPMFQSLHQMPPPWSYYVRASDDVTMTQVAPAINPNAPVSLSAGWRWIGYCVGHSQPITMALASIAGQYDVVLGEHGTYVVGLPDMFQSLTELRQGEGYQIRMTADGTLTYPAATILKASEIREKTFVRKNACGAVRNTPYVTLAYGDVRIAGRPAPIGSVVQALTPRGNVAGCAEVSTAGHFGVMQIYGQDDDGATPGFRPGEAIIWRVNGKEAANPSIFFWKNDRAPHALSLAAGEDDRPAANPHASAP